MKQYLVLATLALLGACDGNHHNQVEIGTRVRTSPALRTFESCDALATQLRTATAEQMRVQLLQYEEGYNNWYANPEAAPGEAVDQAGGADSGTNSPRQEGVDFSGTNNQEAGVDEADFLKTDGYSIFVLSANKLVILSVPEFGELVPASEVEIEGYPSQLLLANGKATVFSTVYSGDTTLAADVRDAIAPDGFYPFTSFTKITQLDVSNPEAPTLEREIYLEGYFLTAREIDGTVRLVSQAYMNIPGLVSYPELPSSYWNLNYDDPMRRALLHQAVLEAIEQNNAAIASASLEAFVPDIHYRNGTGDLVTMPFGSGSCDNFQTSDDSMSHGITSILSLNLNSSELTFEADHLVSNWPAVYASTDTLIVAEPAQDWWWYWSNDGFEEAVNVHRFDIGTPGVTTYTGSGRVNGTVWDPFQISEKDGYIRIAATTGQWNRWWETDPEPSTNHVYVLGGVDQLDVVGEVGGIAPGERLWASRFVGDKAYIVTFQNIDPLWVVDLSHPYAPVLQGSIEVPGVSTYIHPLADGHLLTIGYGGDGFGIDWSAQISLFDVSDANAPTLQDTYALGVPAGNGWNYAWSEATWDHHAFQFWPALNLLAVPASTFRATYTGCAELSQGGYCDGYTYEYDSKLELIQVDATGATDAEPLSHYGSVRHSGFYNSDPYYYWAFRDIRRSIFMGDFIYAVSDRAVTANRLSDLSETASAPLPGTYTSYWAGGFVND